MKTEPTNIKSPYHVNAREADAFEDKVHNMRAKKQSIAIGFETDPNTTDSNFELCTREPITEPESMSLLIYVLTKIAESRGLRTKVSFAPINVTVVPKDLNVIHKTPPIHIELLKDDKGVALAEAILEKMKEQPKEEGRGNVRRIFSFWKKPPETPNNA